MPVTSTLGALSYARATVSAGLNYNYYCLQLQSPYTLQDIVIDPTNSNIYYLSGYSTSDNRYLTSKFTESPDFPLQNYTTRHLIANMASINIGRMQYNLNNNKLVMVTYYTDSISSIVRGSLLSIDPSTGLKVNTNANVYDSCANLSFKIVSGNIPAFVTGTRSSRLSLRKYNKTTYDTSTPTVIAGRDYQGPSGIIQIGVDVVLDSTNLPYFLSTQQVPNVYTLIVKTDTNLNPTIIKYTRNFIGTENFVPARIGIDSSNNPIFISNVSNKAVPDGYVVKWNSAMTSTLWSKRIAGVTLSALYVDNLNNTYVAGRSATTNRLYICKLDNAGIVLYEREIYSTAGFTNVSQIVSSGTDMYIVGNITNGFLIKLPNDGSIPGTGTYSFIGNAVPAINYVTTSKSITNFGISPLAASLGTLSAGGGLTSQDITDTPISQTTYIANI